MPDTRYMKPQPTMVHLKEKVKGKKWENTRKKYLVHFFVLPLSFRHPLSADVGERKGFLTNLVQLPL